MKDHMKNYVHYLVLLLSCTMFHCYGMNFFKTVDETVTDLTSIYSEVQNNNLPRKKTIEINLVGNGIAFIASACATLYGLSNLFRDHSSKLSASIALTTSILGMGYCGYYRLWKNFLIYDPYIPQKYKRYLPQN